MKNIITLLFFFSCFVSFGQGGFIYQSGSGQVGQRTSIEDTKDSLGISALVDSLAEIYNLVTYRPYINLENTTSFTYSSASPLTINLNTAGGSNFSYNTVTDQATFTGSDAAVMKISVSAAVSSSVANELKLSIYDGSTVAASKTIDSSVDMDDIHLETTFDIANTETFEVKIESVDLAGSADLTVHEISVIATFVKLD